MNITARRISGSTFSAEDKLEVTFTSDNQPMSSVVHTIELVSGINVTHGGGGLVGEYLHYKAVERDADADGIIDYSDIEMALVQESQGTSVIKVVAQVITQADVDANKAIGKVYTTDMEAWAERKEVAAGLEEEFTEEEPTALTYIEPTILKTGEITLEWTTDTFV
jgi:carbamate kinase